MKNIAIIGSGKFGTAMANSLSRDNHNNVCIFSRTEEKAKSFTDGKGHNVVFPNSQINTNIRTSSNYELLNEFGIIFIAIPSFAFSELIPKIKSIIKEETIIINLAKGLISNGKTIVEYLEDEIPQARINSLKGPTFASELVIGASSLFTFGYDTRLSLEEIRAIVKNTNIYLDDTKDVYGVEISSLLKNIYAILIGYLDARYNSANTRFMLITKAFQEMKVLSKSLGANDDTMNLACGIGDLNLTALNDLSRNRTLGLLMGKGFEISKNNNVVLEGVRALELISKKVSKNILLRLPLLNLVKRIVDNDNVVINFEDLLKQKDITVITYGTFDLLHYGHLEILRRAKNFGTKLVVGLSTDEFNLKKGKVCVHSYEKRKELLSSLDFISEIIPEDDWKQKVIDVKQYGIDIFVMGDDWKGKFDFLNDHCKVEYLPRTEGISTTELKRLIKI